MSVITFLQKTEKQVPFDNPHRFNSGASEAGNLSLSFEVRYVLSHAAVFETTDNVQNQDSCNKFNILSILSFPL
jgi:hypothetical protein